MLHIAGVDYQPLRTNVTLSPSIASQTLTVPIIQDQITERTESFRARIIVPEETQRLGVQLGSPSELTVNIQDDDCKLTWQMRTKHYYFHVFLVAGNLEIICSTNVTGDNVNGRMIQLFFEANQDATFRCRINNGAYTTCKGGSFCLYQNKQYFVQAQVLSHSEMWIYLNPLQSQLKELLH